MAANILLAEDDRALSALILDFFHAAGLEVLPVFDGEQALAAAAEQSFDLLILDVMMPHFSGLEVCRRVREDSSVPILFITALSQEENALAGFRAGADDYITKPFSFPVLVAKAQAILRRSRGQSLGAGQLAYGSIILDPARREVTVDGRPIRLRPKEEPGLRWGRADGGPPCGRPAAKAGRRRPAHQIGLRGGLPPGWKGVTAVKNFPFSLSWKLTLCSMLMMLLMWAAVGVVLVLNTAEEIMEAQDDEAQRRADLVIQYGDVDMIGYYYRLGQGDHWIEESGRRRGEVLFPTENSSWPSRYSQYTVIRPISADHDSKTVWAETFLGIQVQGAPEGEPWNDRYLVFLENYSPDDLYAVQELVHRSGGTAPIQAVGHADLRHRFFRADTITIGDKSFTNHRTNGQDTYFLGESGEPLEANSYSFSPHLLDRTRMEMMNAVRCHVHGLTIAHPLYERKSSILESYSSGYAFQYDNEEPDLSCSVEVFLLSTPLKSALQEHLGILLRLLVLAPVLGLLFAWAIRKIVVRPLEKTKADFGRVARLDFRGLEGDTRRRDEIGGLNRDLRQMAAELQARWDDERALEQRRQDFAGAASHELKTPLALMRGYTEGLEQGIGDREEYLARMEEQIDRMDRLVLELLEQTRLERMEQLPRMEQVDLTGLIRTLLKQTAPLFDGLTVRTRLQEGCSLSGDRALLERAYGNLLSNAARYCTPGGQVRIQLEQAPCAPVFTIWNHAGPIPETELPRLFEPFYRGDRARDRTGSGMGLAIARKIFTLNRLTIAAENVEDGVQFTVRPEIQNETSR